MRSAVENVQPSGREWERWLTVVVFAVAMSWVEAACVYYLRLVVGRIEPYQAHPLPMDGPLGSIELVREAAEERQVIVFSEDEDLPELAEEICSDCNVFVLPEAAARPARRAPDGRETAPRANGSMP